MWFSKLFKTKNPESSLIRLEPKIVTLIKKMSEDLRQIRDVKKLNSNSFSFVYKNVRFKQTLHTHWFKRNGIISCTRSFKLESQLTEVFENCTFGSKDPDYGTCIDLFERLKNINEEKNSAVLDFLLV
jgi:hypothetical protein